MAESSSDKPYRVLTLDGGGAKGFYSLGALREIEGLVGMPLYQKFDLIFGTSTGAIIAAMLALGHSVEEIHALYKQHVVSVMACKKPADKTARLKALATEVFREQTFEDVKTGIGIVTTKWINDRPMVFKASKEQAHGRQGTFKPGFGCTIADAVQASCSAYPFFEKKTVKTPLGDFELIDGGFCANNPTLYALADVTGPLGKARADIRVVSIGVGEYPPKLPKRFSKMWFATRYVESVTLLQKVMEINTQSMDQLRAIMFKDVPTIRINDSFPQPHMATDLFEHDMSKLNDLFIRGRESYAKAEQDLKTFLL
ncbi:patatin-like phospholipase family protein [Bradyrhizobium iriomotense]|uniref:Patatin n=1 Tax=Bradyrhizobium iriomotense TaxID=441950 RepID=A0ABQ6B5Z0_9BRAD|nr:patatin-like phospholipase family protein [Bradyrhizobium iriomotense]GLR89795.1 patatin [Bradyrhizobium iriomotense]